jgi:diphthine synthase
VCGTLGELLDVDFGAPLHCLVIVGETHPVEKEVRRRGGTVAAC